MFWRYYAFSLVCTLGVVIGAGLGGAIAAAGTAVADPIHDAWPYYGDGWSPSLAILRGSETTTDQQNYGPITVTHYTSMYPTDDPVYFDEARGRFIQGDWYSTSGTTVDLPLVGTIEQQTVTALLDGSASYPNVGTTIESIVSALFWNNSINDPTLGFQDEFRLFSTGPLQFDNDYVHDAAGIRDVVTIYSAPFIPGLPLSSGAYSFTLFEFPATGTGEAASQAGDAFQPLLAEVAGTHLL